jgi:23S rRNA (cytidine1920-2'-O)/16S rRNA (cytidine1409-2'-O)-methyltransferase
VKEKIKIKDRIDALLVEKGILESRTKAKAVIMSGAVYVNGQKVDKPGSVVRVDCDIEVRQILPKYVGRGGIKLEHVLVEFNIDVVDKICLDIGASTGGFTDCLLQYGAQKIYAVDVGYGQLHWRLRNDSRVILKEKLNARYLKKEDIDEKVDIIAIDVSFISLKKVVRPALQFLKKNGCLVCLVKPQFEVGKGEVGRGGVVRETEKHNAVIKDIEQYISGLGLINIRTIESPILGADGNKEFFIFAKK